MAVPVEQDEPEKNPEGADEWKLEEEEEKRKEQED